MQLTRSSAVGDGDIAVIFLDVQAFQPNRMAVQINGALEDAVDRGVSRGIRFVGRAEIGQDGDYRAFTRCCGGVEGCRQCLIAVCLAILRDGSHVNHRLGDRSINGDAIITRFRHVQLVASGNGGINKGMAIQLDLEGLVRCKDVGFFRDVRQEGDHVDIIRRSCGRGGGEGRVAEAVVEQGHWLADGVRIVRIVARHGVKALCAVLKRRNDRKVTAGDDEHFRIVNHKAAFIVSGVDDSRFLLDHKHLCIVRCLYERVAGQCHICST